MVRYATKFGTEDPYTIRNKGPTPRIDREEGYAPGTFDISWVEGWRKNAYHWSQGLPWYERLHAHATMNSARRNAKCKRPFEPKDELDFVLTAAYCPMKEVFSEKMDPYLQKETVFGENLNLDLGKTKTSRSFEHQPNFFTEEMAPKTKPRRLPQWQTTVEVEQETWRILRNRVEIYPPKSVPRDHPIVYSNGGVQRRENIYNVKLGIAADHTPQTNPGYSRTPSGAFYSI